MSIGVIGAVFVDIKGYPDHKYVPTGRNVGRVEYMHGGVARNVAEDIANIGMPCTYLGIVDDSPMGDAVIKRLNEHGVDTRYMLTVPECMGTWLAVFDEKGDLAGSISKRPNLMPILDLLNERGDEIFSQMEAVVLEVDIDYDLVARVFELAKKHGTKIYGVVSNIMIARERMELLQDLECLICNQLESGVFFGDDYNACSRDELCEILLAQVQKTHMHSMVVTMGDQGAVFAGCDGEKCVCCAHKVVVADTTGAGDSFCAGVAVGMTAGKTVLETLEMATDIAASVIQSYDNVCPVHEPAYYCLEGCSLKNSR